MNENLIFGDENKKFFLSISCFETRTSILFFQSKENFREREVSVLLDSRFAFNIESYLCNVHWSCLDLKDDIVSGRHRSPTQRIGCLAVCEDQPLLFAGVNYSWNYCRIWFKPLCYELWREKKFKSKFTFPLNNINIYCTHLFPKEMSRNDNSFWLWCASEYKTAESHFSSYEDWSRWLLQRPAVRPGNPK